MEMCDFLALIYLIAIEIYFSYSIMPTGKFNTAHLLTV